MLEYTLIDNPLTPDPNDCTAQPVNGRSYDLQAIYKRISSRYPGLSPAQIAATVNEFIEEIGLITEEGDTVTTPLLNTEFSMPGVYHGVVDSFDPKRHSMKLNLSTGTRLRDAVKKVKPTKVAVAEVLPHILEVKDMLSDSVNDTITPGGVLQIRGNRLRFLPAEENNGVFFVNEQGQTIKLTVIIENKPARLIVMIPAELPQGEYFVEVRTTFSSGNAKPARNLKTGRFNKILSV
jgi:hypothetical protein